MGKGKYTLRSIIVRCVVIMVGVFITAYGAEAFVLANLGSDPVTAFVQGLSKVLPFVHGDFGMAMNVFNVLCFVVILIVYRKGIGVATVLYTFTLGTFCSMMEPWIIALIGLTPSMVTRVILVITGTLALGVGLGSYQAAGYGAGPSDGFNQFMAKTLKMKLKWWRMIFDAIMVVGALIMGGVIHVATLVGMFCVGPVLGPVLASGQQVGRQRRPDLRRNLIFPVGSNHSPERLSAPEKKFAPAKKSKSFRKAVIYYG